MRNNQRSRSMLHPSHPPEPELNHETLAKIVHSPTTCHETSTTQTDRALRCDRDAVCAHGFGFGKQS